MAAMVPARWPGGNLKMARRQSMDFIIDLMRPQDWEFVKAIHLEEIATGIAAFETDTPDWERWGAGQLPQCRLVAGNGDGVLGRAALNQASKRQVYAGVAEVGVHVGSARGGAVGGALIRALIEDSARTWRLDAAIEHIPRKLRERRPAPQARFPRGGQARTDRPSSRRLARSGRARTPQLRRWRGLNAANIVLHIFDGKQLYVA